MWLMDGVGRHVLLSAVWCLCCCAEAAGRLPICASLPLTWPATGCNPTATPFPAGTLYASHDPTLCHSPGKPLTPGGAASILDALARLHP